MEAEIRPGGHAAALRVALERSFREMFVEFDERLSVFNKTAVS